MTPLEELTELLGAPGYGNNDPQAWIPLEQYLGLALPADYKAFLDAYGSGMIANTLIVSHPACEPDAVARQAQLQKLFSDDYDIAMEYGAPEGAYPYPIHPTPGGLIHWGNGGFDDDSDHFFLPCAPDPADWKIVSLQRKKHGRVGAGSFTAFVLDVVRRRCTPPTEKEWEDMTPEHREWRLQATAQGMFTPGFRPFW